MKINHFFNLNLERSFSFFSKQNSFSQNKIKAIALIAIGLFAIALYTYKYIKHFFNKNEILNHRPQSSSSTVLSKEATFTKEQITENTIFQKKGQKENPKKLDMKQENPLLVLMNECWSKLVFPFVINSSKSWRILTLVNHSFNRLAKDPVVACSLVNRKGVNDLQRFKFILLAGASLEVLIVGNPYFDENKISKIFTTCKNLKTIEFRMQLKNSSKLNDELIGQIPQKVSTLSFYSCNDFTKESLKNFSSLTKLTLYSCSQVDSDWIPAFPSSVQILDIYNCNFTAPLNELENSQGIKSLYLYYCFNTSDNFLKYFSQLETVKIHSCNFTVEGIKAASPKIKVMELTCEDLTEEVLDVLPPNLTSLKLIDSNFDLKNNQKFALLKLTRLSLRGMKNLTIDGIKNIPKTVETLFLTKVTLPVSAFSALPQQLNALFLNDCYFSDEGNEEINTLKNLTLLSLCNLIISKQALTQLFKNLKSRILVLYCVDDEIFPILPRELKELNLFDSRNVTDEGLLGIPPELNILRLDKKNTKTTAHGISKLLEKYPHLQILWKL